MFEYFSINKKVQLVSVATELKFHYHLKSKYIYMRQHINSNKLL